MAEEGCPTPGSEGTEVWCPPASQDEKPTSRRLMRLIGPHASMTTPLAYCCGADLGASGSFLGGIKVEDINIHRRERFPGLCQKIRGAEGIWIGGDQARYICMVSGRRVAIPFVAEMTLAHRTLPQGRPSDSGEASHMRFIARRLVKREEP